MMNLILAPDPVLKKKSAPVLQVDSNIRKLMDDMYETMKKEGGIGLAAVQVGVLKQVIVIDLEIEDKAESIFFIANPEILSRSEDFSSFNEGCLSFPEQRLAIKRPAIITLKYLDYHNNLQLINATGLLATAIQHEIDHTNGIVISDHASELKKNMMMKKAKKIKNELIHLS